MRYIDLALIDKKDPDVIRWLKKARLHLNELSKRTTHDERKNYMASHKIWSEFKPILIKYYGEKCWYSECSLEGAFGEIDHFRPKNKSTDMQNNEILPDGYWWLAYDYLNYRLSCEKSNRSFGDGGKNDITFSSGGIASSSVDADVGSNTITFNGASFFGITTLSAKSGGSNTITDNRNGAKATASTLNSLTAEASGANTLINLKNTTTTTVSAKAGQNAITLDKSSKIGTKLEAADGGANTIVLNSDAKFQDTDSDIYWDKRNHS